MPYGSNFSFVIDSSFQPFTLQEMLVPFAAYKEAFERSEEDYMKLTNEADKFKYLSETLPEDSKARQLYEGYANGLRAQAEDLAHNGLTMGNRRALTDYKRRYQGEIGRIADAQERKRAQWDEQRKMLLQNPTMMYSRRADLTSLDDYLDNPDLSYESYNGALLSQQVSTAASAIAKSLRDYGHGKPLDKFTSTWLQQHGFTAAEVAAAINDPTNPNSSKILNGIVEQAVQSSGIPRWADKATMDQAYAYARQGLWSAVGETKVDKFENYGARLAAQEASQKRVAAHAAALQAAQNGMRPSGGFGRRPLGVQTDRGFKALAGSKKDFDKYKQYFTKDKDGHITLTEAGKKEYSNGTQGVSVAGTSITGYTQYVTSSTNSKFKDWLDGVLSVAGGSLTDRASVDKLYTTLENGSFFDQHINNEYYARVAPSQYDNVLSALNFASVDGELPEYQRKGDNGSFNLAKGSNVNVGSIGASDIASMATVFGLNGNYVEMRLKNGDTHLFNYGDIDPDQNTAVSMHMRAAQAFEQGSDKYAPDPMESYNQLEAAYKSMTTGLGVTKTKDTEVESGYY